MKRPAVAKATGHLWIEEGERQEGWVAEVAPLIHSQRTYSYSVPPELEERTRIGVRVSVPLGRGRRLVEGFVVGMDRRVWDSTLRPIGEVVDTESFLTAALIELGRQIAEHYACPLGRTLKAIVPASVRQGAGLRTVRYAHLKQPIDEVDSNGLRLSPQRLRVLTALAENDDPIPAARLLAEADVSAGVLRSLAACGAVEITTRKEAVHQKAQESCLIEPDFELNAEQREALASIHQTIEADRFGAILLHGVSGSGKTELYVHAIRRVVAAGGQAILLVPEIVLTTQLVLRLAARFEDVAVSHSGLTGAQRARIWREVACGEKSVVIGTRSAVFAPFAKLGLICVDEEQETSFKNLQAPRFHVRDVAIMRAHQLGIPVLLGSATPSLETWHRSGRRSDYQRITLRRRVRDLPMPTVHIVDMQAEMAELKRNVLLSRVMERTLEATLGRGEQALVLVNRRGFAHRLICPSCKTRVSCPNCSVGLVMHSTTGVSMCHYCRTRIQTPRHCPNPACGEALTPLGLGTQRIEDVLSERFPDARIERVDSDTMTHRREYERIVSQFEARNIDVLVGTQMIAKGLDFPFVSCVGVLQADSGAVSADFRGHERMFQLITQVAGRAGRADAPGAVVVQTTTPDLPALQHALHHDYASFANEELDARRHVGMPPFRRLTRIILAHEREETVRDQSRAMGERIRSVIESLSCADAEVLGPNPCVLTRLRGRYRYELLICTPTASAMRELLTRLETDGALRAKVKSVVVDVDPVSMT